MATGAQQAYIDALFPQQQQAAYNPYQDYQAWLLSQQRPSLDNPDAQQMLAYTGQTNPKYLGQNANTYLNNAMDTYTAEQGRQLDLAQALAGQQQWEQEFGLKTQTQDLAERRFAAEEGDPSVMGQMYKRSMDPALLQKAFMELDPTAWQQVRDQIASAQDPDGQPRVTPLVGSIMASLAMDPEYMSEQELADQAAQDAAGQNLTTFASALNRGPQPSYRNAYVRQVFADSPDQTGMANRLGQAAQGGRTDDALRSLFQEHLNQTLNPSGPSPYNQASTLPATGGPEEGGPGWLGGPRTIGSGPVTLGSARDAFLRNAGNIPRLLSPAAAVTGTIAQGAYRLGKDNREALGRLLGVQGQPVSNAVKATPAQLEAMKKKNQSSSSKPKPKGSPTSTTFHP